MRTRWPLVLVGLVLVGPVLVIGSASASAEESTPVRLVTTAQWPAHRRWVRTLAFDPEGKILASGGRDRTLRLWDPREGRELARHTIGRGG